MLCPYHGRELQREAVTDSRGKATTFLRCPEIMEFLNLQTKNRTITQCGFMKPIKNPTGKGRNQNRKTERMNPRRFAAHRKRLEKMIGNASYDTQRFLDAMYLPDKRQGKDN